MFEKALAWFSYFCVFIVVFTGIHIMSHSIIDNRLLEVEIEEIVKEKYEEESVGIVTFVMNEVEQKEHELMEVDEQNVNGIMEVITDIVNNNKLIISDRFIVSNDSTKVDSTF